LKDWCLGLKITQKTRRKEIINAPKYELITSHTMRRSFATNYFGKIETPILMEITGHSRESTFLSYIGENPNKDAVADVFMERLRRLGNEGE
jgi:integrase